MTKREKEKMFYEFIFESMKDQFGEAKNVYYRIYVKQNDRKGKKPTKKEVNMFFAWLFKWKELDHYYDSIKLDRFLFENDINLLVDQYSDVEVGIYID